MTTLLEKQWGETLKTAARGGEVYFVRAGNSMEFDIRVPLDMDESGMGLNDLNQERSTAWDEVADYLSEVFDAPELADRGYMMKLRPKETDGVFFATGRHSMEVGFVAIIAWRPDAPDLPPNPDKFLGGHANAAAHSFGWRMYRA